MTDDQEEARRFDALWKREVAPAVRGFLSRRGVQRNDLDDLTQQTGVRLWQTALIRSAENPIYNLRAYAKRVAYSVLAEHLERQLRQQPERRRLLHAVYAVLNAGELFAVWKRGEERWCGLREWREQSPKRERSERLDAFQTHRYLEFQRVRLGNRSAREFVGDDYASLPVLIAHLFAWIAVPLPVSELIVHLCHLIQISDIRFVSLETPDRLADVASLHPTDSAIINDTYTREYLRQFGVFLCQANLSRCERGSTALALTRETLVALLQVSITALAMALGYEPHNPDSFRLFRTTIWQRIPCTESEPPLTDEQIAQLVGIEATERTSAPQMVANCRSTARRRKWPAWLRAAGWEE